MLNPMDMTGRAVIVTGAGQGIGRADPAALVFRAALGRYFGGEEDPRTVALLG